MKTGKNGTNESFKDKKASAHLLKLSSQLIGVYLLVLRFSNVLLRLVQ